MNRNQEIIRTSVLGIIVNSMLAGFKVMVGFFIWFYRNHIGCGQ